MNIYATGHAENKGLTPANDLSLYDLYVEHGVIPAAEAKGGNHLDIKLGVVYDTRDHENNPTRGTNLEAYVFGSPDIISKRDYRNDYLKLAVHFRQFFPLADRLVFAGHLAFQGLIAGNAPFYSLQTIQPINRKHIITEGLGHLQHPPRYHQRTACRATATHGRTSNFAGPWSKFRWINQNWGIAINPFFDMGMIVAPYRMEQMKTLLQDNTAVATVGTKPTPSPTCTPQQARNST